MVRAMRRIDPFARVVRQIVESHGAAERRRLGDQRLRDLTFVEDVTAILLKQPESLGKIGIAEYLTRRRLDAVDVPGRD